MLREIARRTAGEYILAGTQRIALGDHYLALASRAGVEDSPESLPVYRQRQGWFLLPAFVFLALTLLIADRRKP